jgi:hypothetical protein
VNRELVRPLAFGLCVLCIGVAAAVLLPRVFGLAAGPEVEIITTLKATEKLGLSIEIPGVAVPLTSYRHHYDRVTVVADLEARTAVATATFDFTGKLGDTQVSSLGVEKVRFEYRDSEWKPVDGWAPRLSGVVTALDKRRRALAAADVGRLAALTQPSVESVIAADPGFQLIAALSAREYRSLAWYIRAERDEVLVSEEFRLIGSLPDRPVDEKGARRLSLVRDGREFFFSNGLM